MTPGGKCRDDSIPSDGLSHREIGADVFR
jgi:hypothetical protein